MMNDINTKKDVIKLVDCFYNQVRTNPTIGPIFNEVAQLDWEAHLPQMYNFWASILLGDQSYQGRPIPKHILLDQKEKLQPLHFQTWLAIWESTLNDNFEGANKDEALRRAKLMADLIQYKIKASQNKGFIR